MPSRRAFLNTVAAGLGASVLRPDWVAAADVPEIKTALNGPVGLQLWSLREYLPKDVPGTLAKVRAMGFREVEGAGLWGRQPRSLRAALDKAGLRCHVGAHGLRTPARRPAGSPRRGEGPGRHRGSCARGSRTRRPSPARTR